MHMAGSKTKQKTKWDRGADSNLYFMSELAKSRDGSQHHPHPTPAEQMQPKPVSYAQTREKGGRLPVGLWARVALHTSIAPSEVTAITLRNEHHIDKQPSVITTLRSPYSTTGAAVSQLELVSNLEVALPLQLWLLLSLQL